MYNNFTKFLNFVSIGESADLFFVIDWANNEVMLQGLCKMAVVVFALVA